MEACRDYGESAECHSYTFTSVLKTSDPDWAGECVGRSDQFDVDVPDLWSYSGSRVPCKTSYNSSSEFGLRLHYFLRKNLFMFLCVIQIDSTSFKIHNTYILIYSINIKCELRFTLKSVLLFSINICFYKENSYSFLLKKDN